MSHGEADSLVRADRLGALMQAVGFAVWQLQELETTVAGYITVRLRETRGVGIERGGEIAAKVESRPLGPLIKELVAAGVTSDKVGAELAILLEERNWLVHRARRETRRARVPNRRSETAGPTLHSRPHRRSRGARSRDRSSRR